jgi:hypothetical protein
LVKVGLAGTAFSFESAAAGIAMAAAASTPAMTASFNVDFISDSSWSGCLSLVNLGLNLALKTREV